MCFTLKTVKTFEQFFQVYFSLDFPIIWTVIYSQVSEILLKFFPFVAVWLVIGCQVSAFHETVAKEVYLKIIVFIFQLRCMGFSLQWLLMLWSRGSRMPGLQQLRHVGLSGPRWFLGSRAPLDSCGTQAQLLHGMWDPPISEIRLVFPALAGRFLTTESPGKPLRKFYKALHFFFPSK